MRCSELLADVESRLTSLIERAKAATAGISKDALNRKPDAATWSPAQVFEHMMLGNARYIPIITQVLEQPPSTSGDPEARQTWFGKQIAKAAGPASNAPPPAPMVPGKGPFDLDVVQRWIEQHEELIRLIRKAEGVDLSSVKFRNPFIPLFKMNLADAFAIFAEHAERHVAQIEERVQPPK